MANGVPLVAFPVKDLEQAKKFYNTYLGTQPYADSPFYVGYKVGDQEVGLDPNGTAVVSYVDVDDIEASLKSLEEVGGKIVKNSTDVGGGLLIAQVDFEGNIMGLRQQAK